MNLNKLTIKQASEGIRKKEFSVRELVSACLEVVEKDNERINAYLSIFDDALDEADRRDRELSQYPSIPIPQYPLLYGIPLAIKDNILIEGKICTAGSKILENYEAAYDATVIKNLKSRGAIFLGKTNLDEFAMGSSTENSAFGPTRNPYDGSRVPGGSSGGSAAAVASNMSLGALGSDTGGSVRQPASFCGVVGFKPSYGRVSRHGLMAMASSLDQIGPLARDVRDVRIIFEAISGKDDFDSTSIEISKYRNARISANPKDLRVGVPREYFSSGLDSEVEKVVKSGIGKLEKAGFGVREISLPHSEYALPAYYIVVPSEVSANLARFDGIRYGLSESYKSQAASLYDVYAKTRAAGFGPEVKRRIMLGTYSLSAGYHDAYYLKAQKVRRLVRDDFERALAEVDVILGPTTPTPAFKLGEKTDDPLEMYLADVYTVAAPLAGIPAISLPAGSVEKEGKSLPVGIQLIGGHFEDEKLLDIAEMVEGVIR